MTSIFVLLIAFQIKHLIADYYLQFPYMYENKGKEKGWIKPLFVHSLFHAIGTFLILFVFMLYNRIPTIDTNIIMALLVLFDFVTHFITDRWKASKRESPNEASFWTNLGIDQMIHHTVGVIIVYVVYITKTTI